MPCHHGTERSGLGIWPARPIARLDHLFLIGKRWHRNVPKKGLYVLGQRINFKDAQKITSANKGRIYAKMNDSGTSGFERITKERFPDIRIDPKFKVSKSGKFFTIGSCFARNIEVVLAKQGVECLTSKCVVPGEFYDQKGLGARNGALNAYTPHSMLDLIRLTQRPDATAAGTLKLGEDEWVDMMVSGIRFLTAEELAYVRGMILDVYKALSEADTVVITLGYTESWFDTQDNIFVNRSPGASIKTVRHGERFQFMNASAAQVETALVEIVEEIRRQTSDRAQIILTTSPVPLHGTFTGTDVVCANQYSKSTLLTSAVAVASRYPWVDYYPSYEMVTLSDRSWTWDNDGVHVNPEVVSQVIGRFSDAYFE
jgi:hypothetical protein